jgi:hypothetical protein
MAGKQHLHGNLSLAAMRSIKVSSEEYSTAVAAIAGAAATADAGRIDI